MLKYMEPVKNSYYRILQMSVTKLVPEFFDPTPNLAEGVGGGGAAVEEFMGGGGGVYYLHYS